MRANDIEVTYVNIINSFTRYAMRHVLKRRGILSIAIVLTTLICACGKSIPESSTENPTETDILDEKNYIYTMSRVGHGAPGNWISGTCSADCDVNGLRELETEGYKQYSICPVEGNIEISSIILESGKNISYEGLTCDGHNNFFTVRTVTPSVISAGKDGKVSEKELVKISADGEEVWSSPIIDEDQKFTIDYMVYLPEHGVVTATLAGYTLYNESNGEGEQLFPRKNYSAFFTSKLYVTRDNKLLVNEPDDNMNYRLHEINIEDKALGKEIEFPEEMTPGQGMCPGRSYDFFTFYNNGIYCFNLGDKHLTKKCDFEASNVTVDFIYRIWELDDWNFAFFGGQQGTKGGLFKLTKVDPKDVKEKEEIILGTLHNDIDLEEKITRFNQANSGYKIKLKVYENDYKSGINDAENHLIEDIQTGKMPDILMVEDARLPLYDCMEKGYFEQLDKYLTSDSELKGTRFLQNVMDAGRLNDKLYLIIPSFSVETFAIAADATDRDPVTLENFFDVCAKENIAVRDSLGSTYREMAKNLYIPVGYSFIDKATMTCDFDNKYFRIFLRTTKDLPKWDEIGDLSKYDDYYRSKKSLLLYTTLNSIQDYQAVKYGYIGNDIRFNGIFGATDAVSYIKPNVQFAISSNSEYKDKCWEFIRTYLLDDYQDSLQWKFPVTRKAMDSLMEKVGNGSEFEAGTTWTVSGVDVKMGSLSEEEVKQVRELIYASATYPRVGNYIYDIIEEEAEKYYNDEQTVKEATSAIQKRVSNYLNKIAKENS